MQNVEGLVNHIDYIANLIGINHISLGFDFSDYLSSDTIGSFTKDASSPSVNGLDCTSQAMNIITQLKNRGYRQSDIDLISYGNLNRVFKEILK